MVRCNANKRLTALKKNWVQDMVVPNATEIQGQLSHDRAEWLKAAHDFVNARSRDVAKNLDAQVNRLEELHSFAARKKLIGRCCGQLEFWDTIHSHTKTKLG